MQPRWTAFASLTRGQSWPLAGVQRAGTGPVGHPPPPRPEAACPCALQWRCRGGERAWETGAPPGDAPVPAQVPSLHSHSFQYTVLRGAPVCLACPTPRRVCGRSVPLCGWPRPLARPLGSVHSRGAQSRAHTSGFGCYQRVAVNILVPAFWHFSWVLIPGPVSGGIAGPRRLTTPGTAQQRSRSPPECWGFWGLTPLLAPATA